MAAITAAVQAYMATEGEDPRLRPGQKLPPWKVAARRQTMHRRRFAFRQGGMRKVPLKRFSIF